ncbi:ABC transporter substrate-binding protein [Pleomorphomonas oryzae]|uniref:ABC transporter substrate-binding protein n=1 Tax=Pleomorphomonas oryzae TaxID=261934 RepID=UPI0004092D75|nr:extracellular solute-binding protein [Pleomorphomonas oryzae]
MSHAISRRLLVAAAAGSALALSFASSAYAEVKLSFLVDNAPATVKASEALAAAFHAKNPDITIEVESRAAGGEGDNIVKTRLATGEMTDVFMYNAGSLFHALNPQQNMLDLTDEPYQSDIMDIFKSVVSESGHVYGAPFQTAMGGGVFYNKKVYAALGLQVPKTWADFMKNNETIKAKGGVTPVIQTFKDTWTSQLFMLGDFYNVLQAVPDFPQKYTANQIKYATTPAALRGFEHQAEVFKAGLLNEDFGSASYDDGLRMVSKGEGAHYPMLTFAIGNINENYKDYINDVGFFALPGDDAAKNGLTAWMANGIYGYAQTEHPDEVKKFIAFVASKEGCDTQTQAVGAIGPYMTKSCTLPADVPPAVKDLVAYFAEGGKNAPALEFLSPVKGPALEQITVEIGSGIRAPLDGAKLYDDDVRKQALQLGLPGWE